MGKIFILCIINNLIGLKNSKQKVITLTINQLQITNKYEYFINFL